MGFSPLNEGEIKMKVETREALEQCQELFDIIKILSRCQCRAKIKEAQEVLKLAQECYNACRECLARLGYEVKFDKHSKRPIGISKSLEGDVK
jgi:hypothetical protein